MGRVMPRNVARRALAVTRQALAVALLIGAAVWPTELREQRSHVRALPPKKIFLPPYGGKSG